MHTDEFFFPQRCYTINKHIKIKRTIPESNKQFSVQLIIKRILMKKLNTCRYYLKGKQYKNKGLVT